MTKAEAIEAMNRGEKVAHQFFTSEEWMTAGGLGYAFEDGCTCYTDEFWKTRTGKDWETGWGTCHQTTTI